jgi:hypothetical protein
MKLVSLIRNVDDSNISGIGLVAMGFMFKSGKIVIEWCSDVTKIQSLEVFNSLEELERIHGHNGHTIIQLDDFYSIK